MQASGASSAAAKWLAQKENAADLIGGVNVDGREPMLARTLIDLSQTAQISDSLKVGMDAIVLDTSVFAGTGLHNAVLTASMFRAGAGFTTAADADDHLIFNTSTGKLYYDADGVGGQAAVQIATLTGVSSLTAHDIFIM